MNRAATLLAALVLAAAAGACNKGAAEDAIAEVEGALEAARPELERYAPEELARLSGALGEARERMAEGRYTEALETAQALPARIQLALETAEERRVDLEVAWEEISARLPSRIDRLAREVDALGALAPPAGLDEARAEAARRDIRTIRRAWDDAEAAFRGGEVSRAAKTARDLEAKTEALSQMLSRAAASAPSEPTE